MLVTEEIVILRLVGKSGASIEHTDQRRTLRAEGHLERCPAPGRSGRRGTSSSSCLGVGFCHRELCRLRIGETRPIGVGEWFLLERPVATWRGTESLVDVAAVANAQHKYY